MAPSKRSRSESRDQPEQPVIPEMEGNQPSVSETTDERPAKRLRSNRGILAAVKTKLVELEAVEARERSAELPEDFAVDCSVGIVSKEAFEAFKEAYPAFKPRLYHREDGMLFCYGLPTRAHEKLPGRILTDIILDLTLRQIPSDYMHVRATPACTLGRSANHPTCPLPPIRET